MPLATSVVVPEPLSFKAFSSTIVAMGATPDMLMLCDGLEAPAAMAAVAVPWPSPSSAPLGQLKVLAAQLEAEETRPENS